MTTRPYELLARFANDGSVAGVSVRTITNANGRDYENDPQPLSGATDPAFVAFAAAFSAAIVAQRDQLVIDKASLESQLAILTSDRDSLQDQLTIRRIERDSANALTLETSADFNRVSAQLATMTSERDALQAEVATRDQRIIEVEGQLEALLHPVTNPRHVAPFDFLALLKPEEIFALQTSVDPVVVVGRAKLQTIITYIDLDNQETIGLVRYMESIGLIEAGRADQILSGKS